ncbi:MAG: SufD family Fe-S cluster assembly protein [Bacillales bacterium]|jgi:Fe-S cluster assembly protein SufD|nr:SufD family Fe-S cluster assembly protein [Bacillales bacterium]
MVNYDQNGSYIHKLSQGDLRIDTNLLITLTLVFDVFDTQIKIDLKENSSLIVYYVLKEIKPFNFTNVIVLEKNSNYTGYLLDLNEGDSNIIIEIKQKSLSNASFYSGIIADKNDKKILETKFYNEENNSVSYQQNYGIVRNNASLFIKGLGKIEKGAFNSNNRQDSRLIIFDENSKGKIEPLLFIDENEVQASHSSALGRINEDQIFYLQSRGLSKEEAKKTIIKGFLAPLLSRINNYEINLVLKEKLNYEF